LRIREAEVRFRRVAILSAAAVGCAGGERARIGIPDSTLARAPSTANRPVRTERRFLKASWDTVFVIGGNLSDTLLLRPRILAAGRDGPVVFDYGDHAVKSFDTAGRLRWRFGRSGSGPGEFLNPFNISVGPDGMTWVTDVKLGRITVLSPDGAATRLLRPEIGTLTATVPGSGSGRVLTTSVERFWVRIGLDGRVLETGDLPAPHLRGDVHPYTRQALPSGNADGVWGAVFPIGNDLLVFREGALHCQGELVEGRPAPPVPERGVRVWVAGIAVTDTAVVTLPGGETEDRLRMLDIYSSTTCQYVATVRLPRPVLAIAYARGTFYFEHEEPAPGLMALRLRVARD
jgi:hypothetical protein